jgi:hypothetical protein
MRYPRRVFPIVAVLAGGACSTYFNPGRCDHTSDCQSMAGYSGYVCDLDPNLQGDGRCVPPCTTNSDCTGGRVCNFDSQSVGRCLFPSDGGAAGAGGGGGSSSMGGSAGGSSGAGGSTSTDAGQDVNPCNACAGATPLCLQSTCVECATSSDCASSASKPICDLTSHTCVPCTSDTQCSAKVGSTGNPGVCRSELDGHCAADAETIYVQSVTGCVTTYALNGPGGSAAAPYCSMEPVGLAANPTKTLVVIRGTVAGPDWTYQRGQGQPATLFVGQQSAVIASATTPGFNMDSGTAYIRTVSFSSSASACIEATGGTLNLGSVVVDSCRGGGIYLDGAAFDIENTTVSNNGPSSDLTWGGIRVAALPATGTMVLNLDTVENNNAAGVSCVDAIQGTHVFATGNAAGQVAGTCGFSPCMPMSTTCGAQ